MANSLPFLVTACTVPGPLTRRDHGRRGAGALPVFGDVEGPFKSQVSLLVVVDERGHGIVVATGEHARGGVLFLDCAVSVTAGRTRGDSDSQRLV